jgi:signal transduction histidine kinase
MFTMDFDIEPPVEFEFVSLRSKEGHYALIKADHLYLVTESGISFGEMVKYWVHSGLLFTLLILLLFNGFFIYSVYRWEIPLFRYFRGSHREVVEPPELYDIVQAIAHQVKNPISTVLWTAEKIKRDTTTMSDTNARETYTQLADILVENVKTLKQQTHHISKLVQVHNLNFLEKNLRSVLQYLVEHYSPLMGKNIDIQLKMGEDINVSIDEELLKEAFVILADGIVDAMSGGGTLIISAVPMIPLFRRSPKHILIKLEGAGNSIETVSDISLTICRQIIDAHGGSIEIHNRKGFGTKIAITIPVKASKGG